jgi:acyl transferase domain-containing protein/NAD(P)-dependent dehydrogenase (short-subunit alcohol dehydrogenase family)/acyl carrier protein
MANDFDVAIIGMAGRFPGAGDLAQFWRNLIGGVESIARLSDADLRAAGVAEETIQRANYVKAAPLLEDPALFDAAFFGFSPGEAASLDPQHRLLLELSQWALEDAGCDPERFEGRIGVFAGSAMNTYFSDRGMAERFTENYIPTLVAADKDFLATRVSYKLGLRGPSLTVQTACSTSLVAIHLARQSLLSEETDLALAGAVSVRVPHQAGYLYEGSGVVSSDGHVRAFDDAANGTVFGSGAGVVVLKRLSDAIAAGDSIYAVLKGSAVNNDGSGKAGYTAPSVSGQADAVVEALANAGIRADELSYVEAHGSGTPVGDRIELLALSQAVQRFTRRTGFCALGSVKTNVGHLDAAAGMAGLVKTALALKHGQIPPTLNFTRPNAEIDFPSTPFVVNTRLTEWPVGAAPRRAGVMATGMGGTNAFLVVEEAPACPPAPPSDGPQLLVWSAKTRPALDALTARLAAHEEIAVPGDPSLASVARTLQQGRRAFAERRFLVARDLADARREWANPQSSRMITGTQKSAADLPVAFLLPGIGDHYVGMGRGLYERFAVFRREFDRCAEILRPLLGVDLKELLYPPSSPSAQQRPGIDLKRMLGRAGPGAESPADLRLNQTVFNQPALFAVEYAVARLWMEWGVKPTRLVGHSMGEYVAACLAEVFSLEDALGMIAARARLVQALPPGAMAAVMLSEEEILPLLGADLSLALINGPKLGVVAGPVPAMEAFQAQLAARQVLYRPVRNTHAFHSRLLDPVVEPFLAAIAAVKFSAPRIAFVSNVTGNWITAEQATSPRYWADHARQTARFSDALGRVAQLKGLTLVEVGPGRTLGVLAAQHPAWPAAAQPLLVASLRHSYENFSDVEVILASAGRLWLQGTALQWERMELTQGAGKARLPGYPFQRERHWLERLTPEPGQGRRPGKDALPARPGLDHWFYTPSWRRCGVVDREEGQLPAGLWLIVAAEGAAEWTAHLKRRGARVLTAAPAPDGRRRPLAQCLQLIESLAGQLTGGLNIIHEVSGQEAFYSLAHLAQAIAEKISSVPVRLGVLTTGAHEVTGLERLSPPGALGVGLAGVIGRELPNVAAFAIDQSEPAAEFSRVIREFADPARGAVLAYRGRFRWQRGLESQALPAAAGPASGFRAEGVYLITGGTGGIGLVVAHFLAQTYRARLVLVSRNPHGGDTIAALERAGGQVLLESCDVADPAGLSRVIAKTLDRFGALHGVIHAAGVVNDGMLQLKADAAIDEVLRPKVAGTEALYQAVKDLPLELFVLFSSISAVIPRHGQADYTAANAFLDAFGAFAASDRQAIRTRVINWPGWREVGILAGLKAPAGFEASAEQARARAISNAEGLEAFRRAVASPFTQVVVTPQSPAEQEAEAGAVATLTAAKPAAAEGAGECEPEDEVEKHVAAIWSEALGIGRIGRTQSFLELGGHSLLAMRVVARIRADYAINFTLRKFFENPTVAQAAAAIQAEIVAELEALPDDQPMGAAP